MIFGIDCPACVRDTKLSVSRAKETVNINLSEADTGYGFKV